MYPFYEKIVKSGTPIVCIHKGLLPADYEKSWPGVWEYNTVWDVGKAAKDWPQINFIMYHGALRTFLESPAQRSPSSSRPAASSGRPISRRSPPSTASPTSTPRSARRSPTRRSANPRFAAAFIGTLVRGLGPDRVLWGTDSVWYGSPQWQIEAMRRLEIPEDMQKKHGFAPLGPADGVVKSAIFGGNAVRLYTSTSRRRSAR